GALASCRSTFPRETGSWSWHEAPTHAKGLAAAQFATASSSESSLGLIARYQLFRASSDRQLAAAINARLGHGASSNRSRHLLWNQCRCPDLPNARINFLRLGWSGEAARSLTNRFSLSHESSLVNKSNAHIRKYSLLEITEPSSNDKMLSPMSFFATESRPSRLRTYRINSGKIG